MVPILHGMRRQSDRWLALISIIVIWLAFTIKHDQGKIASQQRDAVSTRVEGTMNRCDLISTIIDTAIGLGAPRSTPDLDRLRRLQENCEETLKKIKEQK